MHVAIIPDGNRRWAKDHHLPSLMGHRRGFDRAVEIGRTARDMGIHTLTLWGFSTENWNRSRSEVNYLMGIFESMFDKHLEEAKKNETRIYHLGRKDRLPKSLLQKITEAEQETRSFTRHVFNIALDYGGHDEILRAIVKAVADSKGKAEDYFQSRGKYHDKYPYYAFKDHLDTGDQPYPYPDLIIRTSGEYRLSGYLLWQSAYSELYFEKVHFPDFTPDRFKRAILEYSNRKRRFGGN